MAKLHTTWICLDCDEVYSGGDRGFCPGQCPACGSRAGWPLCRWVVPVSNIRSGRLVDGVWPAGTVSRNTAHTEHTAEAAR